jgi:hypothetical protein
MSDFWLLALGTHPRPLPIRLTADKEGGLVGLISAKDEDCGSPAHSYFMRLSLPCGESANRRIGRGEQEGGCAVQANLGIANTLF